MDEDEYNEMALRRHMIAVMGSPEHSTDDLDLMALPERLDDTMLERVRAIANSPLPPVIPCSEPHLNKCLRVLLSVLPRRNADDVSGELFVGAYQRKLGHLPNEAVSHIADKAMEKCRWFPTISECLSMLEDWQRKDDHTARKYEASAIARRESDYRSAERNRQIWQDRQQWQPTKAELDELKQQAARNLAAG